MRQTAVLLAGLVLGGLALAPAASAEPCSVVLTCEDAEPETPPPTEAPATTSTTVGALSSAEAAAKLLSLLNGERSAAGLAPFTMRSDITEIASGWTSAMARSRQLAHNDAYFTSETRTRLSARLLGENVAYDGTIDAAHRALMASPPHRANILDGRFTAIGIAAERSDGTWWVTEDFVQPVAVAAPAPTTSTPAAAAAPTPVATTITAPAAPVAGEPAPVGAVLSATAETATVTPVARTPVIASTSARETATRPSAPSAPRVAVLVAVALLAAYALSCASASARIRCRWSPRCTSRG